MVVKIMKEFLKVKSVNNKVGMWLALILIGFFSVSGSAANEYKVDNTNSTVTFAGEHVGMVFSGVFEKWEANIVLPPSTNPTINAMFQLKSAKTGDFTYDSTLAEGDWFDTKNHPKGRFTSQSVETTSNGYKVTGNLELRGVSKPQTFVLERSGNKLKAQFTINRLDYGIGFDSDPTAEWVSRDIVIKLSLQI
jgi:polyisoprenoid-binding protein YceI